MRAAPGARLFHAVVLAGVSLTTDCGGSETVVSDAGAGGSSDATGDSAVDAKADASSDARDEPYDASTGDARDEMPIIR
jgi:hypothetical protein